MRLSTRTCISAMRRGIIYEQGIVSSFNYVHTRNFDYKFSMAWAGTELCGLCLSIPGVKLIVGFLMLQCPGALCVFDCLY